MPLVNGHWIPERPFNGRVPSAVCSICGEPIAVLSRVEWVDALDNKASADPVWHGHTD